MVRKSGTNPQFTKINLFLGRIRPAGRNNPLEETHHILQRRKSNAQSQS